MHPDPIVQGLLDRQIITDVLYRYASTIDVKDYATLRTLFTPDARGIYGDRPAIEGGDRIVEWIEQHSGDRNWQHHLLSVYHVDIDGDTARTLTYHTSHQTSPETPGTVAVIVARYHDVLRRVGDTWKISEKVMEIGWRESRTP